MNSFQDGEPFLFSNQVVWEEYMQTKRAMKGKRGNPLASRIKKVMQADEDVGRIAQATPILIGKLSFPLQAYQTYPEDFLETRIIKCAVQVTP